jgi:hypothetical protein
MFERWQEDDGFGLGNRPMRVVLIIALLSTLPQHGSATPLEDRATAICPNRDAQSLQNCYVGVLKSFRGQLRERTRMDPQDAAAYCKYAAEPNDAQFCNLQSGKPQPHRQKSEAQQALPQFIEVVAQGVSVVPGAIVCPDFRAVQLVFQLYGTNWEEETQDALTHGQSRLIRGAPSPKPNLELYGCTLIPPGTPMTTERGNGIPVVTAPLPDGRTIKGVTLPAMIAHKSKQTVPKAAAMGNPRKPKLESGSEAAQQGAPDAAKPVNPFDGRTAIAETAGPQQPDQDRELARVQKLNPVIQNARQCIRNNIASAYQSGVYGLEQATSFFMKRCFEPYSAAHHDLGFDDIAEPGFKLLVAQALAPK